MTLAKICDRCGSVAESDRSGVVELTDSGTVTTSVAMDLCDKCFGIVNQVVAKRIVTARSNQDTFTIEEA